MKPMTREQKLEYWRLCRIILDYKRHAITKEQAFEEFRAHIDLPKVLAKMLFEPMRKEKADSLRRAYPDWIGEEPDITVPWISSRELRWEKLRKHKKY
jgi:hypothetical protein